MNAGYADVINARHSIPHRGRSNGGLLSYRDIRCTGGYDRDRTVTTFGSISQDGNHPGVGVKLRFGCQLAYSLKHFFGISRDQQVRAVVENAVCDLCDLFRSLSLSKNHFGESEPEVAMVIDARESYVLVRQARHLVSGFFDIDASGLYLLEQLFDSVTVH